MSNGYLGKESSLLKKEIIYFIGIMGSGKSTLSKEIAKYLNYNFLDTDTLIEEREKKSINKIFEESGEDYFRKLESSVLEYVSKKEKCVVATGGGVIIKEKNRALLKSTGTVIFINSKVEDIINNINTKNRPLLKVGRERLINLYKERELFYKETADIIFDDIIYGNIPLTVSSLLRILQV